MSVSVLRETFKDMVAMIVWFESELQKPPGQAYFNYEKYYSANIYLRSHQSVSQMITSKSGDDNQTD